MTDTNAAQAVHETVELAEYLDTLGYRRFWLAEHHNTSAFAGAAPEILIGHIVLAHAAFINRLRRRDAATLQPDESGRTISHAGQPVGRTH